MIYDIILIILKPFVAFIAKIHAPFSIKKVDGIDYYKVRKRIQPGTVLLTVTRGELSNVLNPERIKHGAIYVGRIKGDEVCYVQEATGDGIVYTDLVTFLLRKDFVLGYEPQFDIDIAKMEHRSKELDKADYDYLFKHGGNKYYCFELCASIIEYSSSEKLQLHNTLFGKIIYSYRSFKDDDRFTESFRIGEYDDRE